MLKKIKYIFIILISIITLNSCSFDELVSLINDKYYGINENSGFHCDDTGNSIELLEQAFNGKIDQNGNSLLENFEKKDNDDELLVSAKRLNIDYNLKNLPYFDGSTPSIGKLKGLVIPVDFADYPISDKIYENTSVSWQSVSSFYYNSSYGKLDLSFDILPWFRLSRNSTYYQNMTENNQKKYTGETPGVSAIIHEVLRNAQKDYDLSQYDGNNDGYIDALHIIYSKPMNYTNDDIWWAFQYYNFEYKEYDKVCPYYYVFSSFHFLFKDDEFNNTKTLIHETGHLFGLDDYYDYSETEGYNKGGLGGFDMMDNNFGDHNPLSKLLLGWINNPILVELKENSSTTINISPSSKNGDIIILANEFDEEKGIFQSYFIIEYINFNSMLADGGYDIFTKSGIRVYRVNAELMTYKSDDIAYEYFKYNNSKTKFNLIDSFNNGLFSIYPQSKYNLKFCANNSDLYFEGDSERNLHYSYISINERENLEYTFHVRKITDEYATIVISR